MKTRAQIIELGEKNQWRVLYDRDTQVVLFKWSGNVRHEVSIVFDKGGRIRAWSRWANQRITLDEFPGLRDRCEDHLVTFL